mgnify:CR=1 FL=1
MGPKTTENSSQRQIILINAKSRGSRRMLTDRPLIMHENTTIRLRYEDFDAKSNFAGSSEQQMPPPPAGLIL